MDKTTYKEKLEAQLKEWQGEIDKLKAEAEKKSTETKATYQERINELEQRTNQVKEKLSALKETGDDKWEDVRKEIDKETTEIKAQIKDLLY